MTTNEVSITFHGSTFLEIVQNKTTIFVDPVFSSTRRGRRVRGETRACDYVFLSRVGDDLEDVLDLLEDSSAIVVGSERTTATVKREIDLGRDRALDLEPWERANDEAFRVTALPTIQASLVDDGVDMLQDLMGSAQGLPGLPRALSSIPLAGTAMRGARALTDLPGRLLGANLPGSNLLGSLRGKSTLGYRFELTTGQKIVTLTDGVHAGSDERDLEDIAALGETDVLILDAVSRTVDPVVRAVRAFEPKTVLLYRSVDPYGTSRRSQSLPIRAYLDALQEDQGDDVEALHIRTGDRYVIDAPAAAAASAPKPAASTSTAAASAPKPATKPAQA